MKLSLSEISRKRILQSAESSFNHNHWGNSDLIVPEYDILYQRLKQDSTEFQLTLSQIEIIIGWIADKTRNGAIRSGEDSAVIDSLSSQLKTARQDCSSSEAARIDRFLHSLSVLNGSVNGPVFPLEH